LDFDDIRAYVSHKPVSKESELTIETVPFYEERAAGEFNNPVKNEKLHNIIEKIRASIHDHQN
jgi:hypothetical protein